MSCFHRKLFAQANALTGGRKQPLNAHFTASMRSRYTFTSLCVAIADSIWGQVLSSHAAKARPRILPTRKWMTRGGGTLSTMRCEKSASFVTIARSCCCAWPQSWESVGRGPRSKAWVTGRPVCREGTRGRFSSKRKPLMPHVRANTGYPSAGPRDQHKRAPARGGATGTQPARPPRNHPPPASPARTGRRCGFPAAQAARCTLRDQSRSSLNSCVKVNPDPGCRQAASCSSSRSPGEVLLSVADLDSGTRKGVAQFVRVSYLRGR